MSINSIIRRNDGVASIPVIIGIITALVFVGIVIAAIRQEQQQPQPNAELETFLEHGAPPPSENEGILDDTADSAE